MTTDQAENCKKIHLKVASGSSVRALLHDNIIYCSTVTRPLISVGQLKSMLDLRFIWSDSAPLLVACSGGLKYILLEASVFHNLPVIDSHEVVVLLEAIHHYTATGTLWNATTWSKKLNRRLSLFHWSTPSHPIRLPQDDAAFTDDPQVMFSSMQIEDLLAAIDETPLLPSLQVFSLQSSSSSSSSSQALPPSSSDVLPSSLVPTFNLEDQDAPTEDEESTRKEEEEIVAEKRGSQSQISLGMKEGKVRQETRRRKTDDTVFTDSTTTSSTIDNAFTSEKSAYKRVNFANFDCHTSSFTTDLDSVNLQLTHFYDIGFPGLVRGQM